MMKGLMFYLFRYKHVVSLTVHSLAGLPYGEINEDEIQDCEKYHENMFIIRTHFNTITSYLSHFSFTMLMKLE